MAGTDGQVSAGREFVADTTALVIFFTAAGVVNERFVVGMGWDEVLRARLIGAPLMVLTARPYGLWRAAVLDRAAPRGRLAEAAWDTAALVAFQVPIYVAIIFAGGARGTELALGAAGAVAYMLALGRPYGLFLDRVRAAFGLPPGGRKPMSPGG